MKILRDDKLEIARQIVAGVQTIDSVQISEPRIAAIYAQLRALLKVVQLESNGEPIEVDGFRLKNLDAWVTPQPNAFSELAHISSTCNMRCPFCYEEGDPDGCSTLNDYAGMAPLDEMRVRLRLRQRHPGQGLFRPLTNINEIFCNPHAIDIIEELRAQQPHEVLTFVTNGTYLTEEIVARLAQLRPIFFNFSVNSLDPNIRRRILRDRSPYVAIESLDLLRAYEIPYLGSLVCWPTIPWDDIRHTVRVLAEKRCAIVRFSLSAYSQHLKGHRFDRLTFWQEGVAVARQLMQEVDVPIRIEPYHFFDPSFGPNVVGAIPGSPAHRAGLRPQDRIVAVGGRPVLSANQALTALTKAHRTAMDVEIEVERAAAPSSIHRLRLTRRTPNEYPFNRLADLPGFEWGAIVTPNLKFSYLQDMRRQIARAGANRVLVCSSELMKPIVEDMIARSAAFDDVELHLGVPENRYFGGTIVLGDLLVVEDYVAFINEFIAANGSVDLVLIPSSPFSLGLWRRDLRGRPFAEIERRVGAPVELIEIHPLAG